MKQKVIICGAGRVGTSITEHLSNEGFDITIIDSSSEAIQRITELYDVQGVLGLASYPNVLEDAGIIDTDLIIAVTQSDEINIAACHVAKSIFETPNALAFSSFIKGSKTITSIFRPIALSATIEPIFPQPIKPKVLPVTSEPINFDFSHFPFLVDSFA